MTEYVKGHCAWQDSIGERSKEFGSEWFTSAQHGSSAGDLMMFVRYGILEQTVGVSKNGCLIMKFRLNEEFLND